jgi:hypothetical protein
MKSISSAVTGSLLASWLFGCTGVAPAPTSPSAIPKSDVPPEQKTFNWELQIGPGFHSERLQFPISISKTSTVTLTAGGVGRTCSLQGTYTDYGVILENTDVKIYPYHFYQPDRIEDTTSGTIPAGTYLLTIFLSSVSGGTSGCLLSATLKHY